MPIQHAKALIRLSIAALLRRRLRGLFVLSTGRCGTKTLSHILNASPDIYACHEPNPMFLKATQAAYRDAATPASFSNSFTYTYLHARLFRYPDNQPMRQALWKGAVYAECSNRMTYVAEDLARFLPRSRFIFLHRHPSDFVRSGMRRGYYTSHKWDSKRITPRPGTEAADHWDSWDAFQRTCWYWNEVNSCSLAFARSLPPERCFILPSAQLFDAASETLPTLFAWCGVAMPDRAMLEEILAHPLNTQQDGAFPKAEAWNERQRETLLALAGHTMTALNYDLPHR